MAERKKLFFFGVGNTATWVANQARDRFALFGTTRQTSKVVELERAGIEPILITQDYSPGDIDKLKAKLADAFVLVSYPPDRASDERFGALVAGARGLVYISSTGVYGKNAELVNESTEVDT